MATFIIPADGSSVAVGDFGKAADEALRRHNDGLSEQDRKEGKAELEQLSDAVDAAKQMVRSKAFGEHVYVVVSSVSSGTAWPLGSGKVVDIRVESRGAPQRPQAEQEAQSQQPARRLSRAEQRQAARDAKRNVSATQVPGVQQAPAPTPYMPGSRAEEIAAGRDPRGPEHTVVPPSTGSSAYMPGSRPEELAAGRPLSEAQGPQVPSTQEEAQAAANRNAAQAEEQTRQAGRRAGRSTSRSGSRSSRGNARSSRAAGGSGPSGPETGARVVRTVPPAGRAAARAATSNTSTTTSRSSRRSARSSRASRTVKADPSLRQRGTSPKSNA